MNISFIQLTKLLFGLFLLFGIFRTEQLKAQDIGNHHCIVTLTNDKNNNNGRPLTHIESNVFEVPLTETRYGIKVDEAVKRQICWQYFNYLYENHYEELSVFKGGFREGSFWLHITPTRQEVQNKVDYNFGKAFDLHNRIKTKNFTFNQNEKKDSQDIMNIFKSFFTEGKSIHL